MGANHNWPEGSSSSSNDEEGTFKPRPSRRRRRVMLRSRARLNKYLDLALDEGQAMSLLEYLSAQPETVLVYRAHLLKWLEWADDGAWPLVVDEEVDAALVSFMNKAFLAGLQSWNGERLLAALLFYWPEFSKLGVRRIPRAWRVL